MSDPASTSGDGSGGDGPRVLVQGAGALGRLVAARLGRAGVPVTLLLREDDATTRARFAEYGIELVEHDGERYHVPVEVAPVAVVAGRSWPLLVVCVKAFDLDAALQHGVRWVAPDGAVLVLSNGVGNLEIAARHWSGHCLAGAVHCGAHRVEGTQCAAEGTKGPGVRAVGPGMLYVGSPDETEAGRTAVREVAELFRRGGFEVDEAEDVERVIWEKMVLNCAINPVATLLDCENGRLLDTPAIAAGVQAAREVVAVGRAAGVNLDEDGWRERVVSLCKRTAKNRCSMLEDVRAGRRTEIDALCGAVVRIGEQYGVAAPTHRVLAELVRSM